MKPSCNLETLKLTPQVLRPKSVTAEWVGDSGAGNSDAIIAATKFFHVSSRFPATYATPRPVRNGGSAGPAKTVTNNVAEAIVSAKRITRVRIIA